MDDESEGKCTKLLVKKNTEENHEKYQPGSPLASNQSLNLAPPEY
jgi:hypothetical protein